MSDVTILASDDEAAERKSAAVVAPARKKKLLVALLALLLVGGAGGAGWWWFAAPPADALAEPHPDVFVEVPPIEVALRGADGASRFLKLRVMLVPGTLDAEPLTVQLPRLIDRFQPFLRELRPEDLQGSAATFRVKEELLVRSNQVLGPGAVRDVLIQDLVQQ